MGSLSLSFLVLFPLSIPYTLSCPSLGSPLFGFVLLLVFPSACALGFLALSIYLSLSVLLSYLLSVDLLFVCERENETMILDRERDYENENNATISG